MDELIKMAELMRRAADDIDKMVEITVRGSSSEETKKELAEVQEDFQITLMRIQLLS